MRVWIVAYIRFYLGNRSFKDYLQTYEMDLKGKQCKFLEYFTSQKEGKF